MVKSTCIPGEQKIEKCPLLKKIYSSVNPRKSYKIPEYNEGCHIKKQIYSGVNLRKFYKISEYNDVCHIKKQIYSGVNLRKSYKIPEYNEGHCHIKKRDHFVQNKNEHIL